MRKALFFTGVITLLSLFILAGVFCDIAGRGGDVQITEKVLRGDRSLADGLSVKFAAKDEEAAGSRWTVSYTLAEDGSLTAEANFRKETRPDSQNVLDDMRSSQIGLTDDVIDDHYAQWFTMAEAVTNCPFFEEPLQEAASRTDPGATHTEEFSAADYLDHLPVKLTADNATVESYIGKDSHGSSIDLSRFQIPVPKSCKVTVEIEKNKDGDVISAALNGFQNTAFDSCGVLGEEGCYLAVTQFDQYTEEGLRTLYRYPENLRGVHLIPYDRHSDAQETPYRRLDMGSASLVFPLPEDARVLRLFDRPEKQELVLFTEEKQKAVIRVIDKNTMKLKQKLLPPESLSGEEVFSFQTGDDYILLTADTGLFILLYKKDGAYRLLSGSFSAGSFSGSSHSGSIEPAGVLLEKDTAVIAAVSIPPSEYRPLDHYLLICDQSGVLYEGFYHCSLQSDMLTRNGTNVAQDDWRFHPVVIERRDKS